MDTETATRHSESSDLVRMCVSSSTHKDRKMSQIPEFVTRTIHSAEVSPFEKGGKQVISALFLFGASLQLECSHYVDLSTLMAKLSNEN